MDQPQRPNILFLLSDEHSHRFLGHRDPAGDGEPVETPALDALAGRSVAFDNTYCQAPLCTPSRMCLLTGRSVRGCEAWNNWSHLSPDLPTLPGVLADAGYETCLVGKMHFGGNRQYYGFRHRPYGDLTGGTGHQKDPLTPRAPGNATRQRTLGAGVTDCAESQLQEQLVVRESLAFLREHRAARPEQPWMLCASFSRPHFPLTAPRRWFDRYWPDKVTPPKVGRTGDSADHPMSTGMYAGFQCGEVEPDEMMRARAGYFACVSYLDEILGDMLAMLQADGLLDNTIVVYSSDHGEMAGEHGLWWKASWHEASTRVPFFIQLPQHRRGELPPARLHQPVSLADLFPTLCGLAGVEAPDSLEGFDLSAAVLDGAEPSQRGPVFSDWLNARWGPGTEFRMVRDGDYKYVGFRDAPPLLFNLRTDPLEQRNLALHATGEDRAVLDRLSALVRETVDFDETARAEAAAMAVRADNELPDHLRHKNLYEMPDGRLIGAERTILRPDVYADSAAALIRDAPPRDRRAVGG